MNGNATNGCTMRGQLGAALAVRNGGTFINNGVLDIITGRHGHQPATRADDADLTDNNATPTVGKPRKNTIALCDRVSPGFTRLSLGPIHYDN